MGMKDQCLGNVINDPGKPLLELHDIQKTNVFIVHHDKEAQHALRRMITSTAWEIKTYFSAESFLDEFDPARPGCLLLDVHVPKMGGLSLQKQLRDMNSFLPILFISSHGTVPEAVEAIHGGAADFFTKPWQKSVLLKRLWACMEKDQYARENKKKQEEIIARMARLTPREWEVMELVVKGRLNKVIAFELGISLKTVENHRAQVMKKLQVKTQADLIRLALLCLDRMEH
ncbi:regulatory protein LuxR [Nitrosococcus halophilus Nc 4]|uniref:Regulatory protein LuxR n=1 Tax=Nitrosococcus halophilus (strain Nc4) TaxID=472759 RepID=D5C1V3_NITHN|nr:response regulator [Nitrosococcus halophilus]ADE14736.1 regulatory protein LuxR [Nitrosococcus halophilus Nc 4]